MTLLAIARRIARLASQKATAPQHASRKFLDSNVQKFGASLAERDNGMCAIVLGVIGNEAAMNYARSEAMLDK
ncbi:MAG: hypothetical protein DMG68_14010 [Acidobacteria bacterium]|nr:MAG: hypothetical protein DMG68_14010 [Acidobacteriota bacterium]